ncbi:dipeptidase [Aliiroseovarius crassostreae]|uniref:dipeptidase n=1 Tax=Aliiroseovarius crassostreae TaxID=154981 RepID=UPI0021AFB1F2|nr:membrane dipeptidase [Aliiroseovarius crassostreae]UWP87891.1 membrane dipeptidase [Aliiroseovarius crassostreae]
MKWVKRGLAVVLGFMVLAGAGFLIFAPRMADQAMNPVNDHAPYPISDAARALHQSLTIGDWHADSLLWKRSLLERHDYGHVDLPRLQEGNVAVQVFTAVTKSPSGLNYDENAADARDDITLLAVGQLWPLRTWSSILERAIYQAERLHGFAAQAPSDLRVVRTLGDLEAVLAARAEGADMVAGILGVEGAHPLEGKMENLDRLERAGYRLIGLQHFFDNELGGSLHGQGNNGLTDFGRQVVAEVAARGMVLDLAHSSTEVVRDVLAMTDMPLVISHTGLHSHCQTKRNIPDDLMRQVAATGGVIGIGYWADVTCDDSPAGVAAAIRAAIAAVGEDAVSYGSDYDGTVRVGFDTSDLAALTQAMLDAGLSERQIRKVSGENMLRVLRARLRP